MILPQNSRDLIYSTSNFWFRRKIFTYRTNLLVLELLVKSSDFLLDQTAKTRDQMGINTQWTSIRFFCLSQLNYQLPRGTTFFYHFANFDFFISKFLLCFISASENHFFAADHHPSNEHKHRPKSSTSTMVSVCFRFLFYNRVNLASNSKWIFVSITREKIGYWLFIISGTQNTNPPQKRREDNTAPNKEGNWKSSSLNNAQCFTLDEKRKLRDLTWTTALCILQKSYGKL